MLTDDELTTELRTAFAAAVADLYAPTELTADVQRRHRTHQRRTATSLVGVPALAAAVITVVAISGAHDSDSHAPAAQRGNLGATTASSTTATDAIRMTFAGYTLTVPVNSTRADARVVEHSVCGSEAAFEHGGPSRLVTNPSDPSCPVTLGLTKTAPPTNAQKINLPIGVPGHSEWTGFVVNDATSGGRTVYLPVPREQDAWIIFDVESGRIAQPLLAAILRTGFPANN
jgi:hypothetical protein